MWSLVLIKLIRVFICLAFIRGLLAFLAIPILWFLNINHQIITNFWTDGFIAKGSPVYNPIAFYSAIYFLIFFIGFTIWIYKNKALDSINLKSSISNDNPSTEIIAYLLMLIFFIKKIITFLINPEYFDHPFFEKLVLPEILSAQITHMFLPNVIGFTAAFIFLNYYSSIFSKTIGVFLFALFFMASFNYESRALVIQNFFLISCLVYLNGYMTKQKVFYLLVLILTSFFMMSYSSQTFSNRILSILMRFDVYHLVTHSFLSNVIFEGDFNDYVRKIGIVSINDDRTGVGFPIYIDLYLRGFPLSFSVILGGMILGVFLGALISLLKITHPVITPIILCYIFKLLFFWPDISISPLIDLVIEILLFLSFVIILLISIKSLKHLKLNNRI